MSKNLEKSVDASNLFQRAKLDEAAAERAGYSDYSYWGSTLRVFSKNRVAMVMLIVLVLLLIFTVIQPYLPGQRNPNTVNNHPATGIQLSNQSPSFSAELLKVPEGTELTVKEYDDAWYEASNVVGSINKRTDFTCLEYGDTWCRVEYDGQEGYVQTSWLKLPDEIPEGPFTVKSNYKISLYASAAGHHQQGRSRVCGEKGRKAAGRGHRPCRHHRGNQRLLPALGNRVLVRHQ